MFLDSKLNFGEHLKYITNKVNKSTGLLHKIFIKNTYEISWRRLPTESFINYQLIYQIVSRIPVISQYLTTMEKAILDVINHIKSLRERKPSLDNTLQRINKIFTTNLDIEALTSELEKMILKA